MATTSSVNQKRDDGGPAFPRPASEDTSSGTLADGNDVVREQDGMSLRDYFAAHASRTPHSWFIPAMPTPRPALQFHDGHNEEHGCVYDGMCPPLNRPAVADYDAEYQRQFFVQWPYAWADAMLAERKR